MVRYVEHLPDAPEDDRQLDDMSFAFYDEMLVFDHIKKTIVAVTLAWPDRHESPESAFEDANVRLEQLFKKLTTPAQNELACTDVVSVDESSSGAEYRSNCTQKQFESNVNQCIDYICLLYTSPSPRD